MNISKMIKSDKAAILSDAVLCAVLNIEAESIGVSLEAYVDKFLEVFYNEPQKLRHILTTKV